MTTKLLIHKSVYMLVREDAVSPQEAIINDVGKKDTTV